MGVAVDKGNLVNDFQILAGSVSSLIFMLGNLSMLLKAWRTRDVHSYSLVQLLLNNFGNAVHWIYVVGLPFGPIWFLHGFFTLSSAIMLFWCVTYRRAPITTLDRTKAVVGRFSTIVNLGLDGSGVALTAYNRAIGRIERMQHDYV